MSLWAFRIGAVFAGWLAAFPLIAAAWDLDTAAEWRDGQGVADDVGVVASPPVGGRSDLMGNGALMLDREAPDQAFWKQGGFVGEGEWRSTWREATGGPHAFEVTYQVYGREQDMRSGWVKFKGNPLVCDYQWHNASPQSLQLPEHLHDRANDQSLERGAGPFEGQWLLLFNVGAWAVKGWAMATAPSLEPLKRGENPFRLYENPYPLFGGTGGTHAPNDWIYAEGTWYAPDETKGGPSHMWTAKTLDDWQNGGEIVGINGHDPGMVYDGEQYYLFNETKQGITYCTAENPLGPWTDEGLAFPLETHTGDADVVFFNNRWHMVYDDGPHLDYELGYAWTTPEAFPEGWRLEQKFFGPRNPEQGQVWDEPTEAGNEFGTGDGDLAIEGNTLYMVYERPIGIAYKELDVLDTSGTTAELRLEFDTNGDGELDAATPWRTLVPGKSAISEGAAESGMTRVAVRLASEKRTLSPMITELRVGSD